jgi:hypothetical protein
MCATVSASTPGGAAVGRAALVDEGPPDSGREARVHEEHRRRRRAQRGRRHAQLVPDAGDHEQAPEHRDHAERQSKVVTIERPEGELRSTDEKGAEREPAPPLPEQHSHRSAERDDHERQREGRRVAVDQDWRCERAEDAQSGHQLRTPVHGDRRTDRTDQCRDEEAQLLTDDVLDCSRIREGGEESRQGGGHGGDGGIGLVSALVQEEADTEQQGRAQEGERDPGFDSDPAAVDGDDEEEDDADEDREAADPSEDAAAEQVLERLTRFCERARRGGSGGRRDGLRGGRRRGRTPRGRRLRGRRGARLRSRQRAFERLEPGEDRPENRLDRYDPLLEGTLRLHPP